MVPSLESPFAGRGSLPDNDTTFSKDALRSTQELDLAPEAQRAYDAIVRPSAIVPVARYFLDHWLPLLGSSRAWLTLAFRQVAFVSRAGVYEVPVQTTLRKLGRWAGLSHVRVHQVLKKPDRLTWFVRNPEGDLTQERSPRSNAPSYLVRADIPLTPSDQARLTLWLEQRAPTDDKAWVLTLEEATDAQQLELPEGLPLPEISLTIQQIVYAQRAVDTPLPPSLDEACTELHSRWVQPDRVTLITHYFITRWLPRLSPGLGWLIVSLRSQVYLQENLNVGQVWIRGGWARLAASLGISRKSLSRWITSQKADLFFQRRDGVSDPGDRRHVLLYVRLSEPIHPDDQDEYLSFLAGQDLTTPMPIDGQNLTGTPFPQGQSLTSGGEPSTNRRKNLTPSGQELPPAPQKLTSDETLLNKTGTKLNVLSTLSSSFQESIQVKTSVVAKTDTSPSPAVTLDEGWQLASLLQKAGMTKRLVDDLSQASAQAKLFFIGWLYYALTVANIRYPGLFAGKRYLEGPPADAFLQLAQVPLRRCIGWLTGRTLEIPERLEKTIVDLRKGHAYDRLREMGAFSATVLGEHEPPERQQEAHAGSLTANDDRLSVAKAWRLTRAQLQSELEKTTYDTWVRDIELLGFSEQVLLLGTANAYARDWLYDRLKSNTEKILGDIMGKHISVRFVVTDDIEK